MCILLHGYCSSIALLILEDWRSLDKLVEIQVLRGMVLDRPLMNLVEILACMHRVHIADEPALLPAPLPGNGGEVRRALQRLSQLLVAMLHMEDVIFSLFRARRQIHRIRCGIDQFAHHVQAVQLVENVELHDVVVGVV